MISSKFHLLQISTCPVRDFWAAQQLPGFWSIKGLLSSWYLSWPLLVAVVAPTSSRWKWLDLCTTVSQNGVVSLQRSNWKWGWWFSVCITSNSLKLGVYHGLRCFQTQPYHHSRHTNALVSDSFWKRLMFLQSDGFLYAGSSTSWTFLNWSIQEVEKTVIGVAYFSLGF